MKLFLIALEMAVAPFALSAQTDPASATNAGSPPIISTATNAPAQKNVLLRAPTEIFSERGDFDLRNHTAVYTGNVRVLDPRMKLTCELLTASVPEGGGRVDRIVAERNVVIDVLDKHGEHVRATGQKAVYTYKVGNSVTNETVELTGDPRLQAGLRSATGDSIVWDRINDTFHGSNLHIIYQQPVKESSTNNSNVTSTNTP